MNVIQNKKKLPVYLKRMIAANSITMVLKLLWLSDRQMKEITVKWFKAIKKYCIKKTKNICKIKYKTFIVNVN